VPSLLYRLYCAFPIVLLTRSLPWQPEHPLKRSVVVSVRASLEDLCLRKAKATWSPSTEATAAILKQQKFIDLAGTSEKVWQNTMH
jgi:hypothetical protein